MNIPAKITDSTGGSASSTLAAATNIDTLTGTLTGTLDNALADITFNATWSQGQADTVNKNFKEVQAELVTQRALNTVLINAVASLAAKVNTLIANDREMSG